MKHLFIVLFTAVLANCSPSPAQVEVSDATLYLHPVEGRPSAVYFSLKNKGSDSDRLLSVGIDGAERGEIHTTEDQNGIAKMIRLTTLEIPGNSDVVFKRGGHHVMAFGMPAGVKTGDQIRITLQLEKSGTLTTQASVKPFGR